MPYKPGKRREFRAKVPPGLVDRMHLLFTLSGETKASYVTRVLTEAVERDLQRFPVHVAWLRPGATMFKRIGTDTYVPICKAPGGERVWPIQIVKVPPNLCQSMLAWEADITSTDGGFEGREVIVPIEDVIGSHQEVARSQRAAARGGTPDSGVTPPAKPLLGPISGSE